jgi:hypothetical protein
MRFKWIKKYARGDELIQLADEAQLGLPTEPGTVNRQQAEKYIQHNTREQWLGQLMP